MRLGQSIEQENVQEKLEYKLTSTLLVHIDDGEDTTAGKDDKEHLTTLFKDHCSAMDEDYGFIDNV